MSVTTPTHVRMRVGLILMGGFVLIAPAAVALEERVDDLAVSVEVAPVFEFAVTDLNLAFTNVSPGTTKVLGAGRFFNEFTCRSNSGHPWYLTAQVRSLQHAGGRQRLPIANLKWKVVESTGTAKPAGGRDRFHAFSAQPAVIYTGRGVDLRGHPVVLRLQYSLTVPGDALAGNYVGQLVFTMADHL